MDTGALRKSQPPPGNFTSICISGCSLQEGRVTPLLQMRSKRRVLVTGHANEFTEQVNKRREERSRGAGRALSQVRPPHPAPSSSLTPHLARWGQSSPGISCFLPSPLQCVTLRISSFHVLRLANLCSSFLVSQYAVAPLILSLVCEVIFVFWSTPCHQMASYKG